MAFSNAPDIIVARASAPRRYSAARDTPDLTGAAWSADNLTLLKVKVSRGSLAMLRALVRSPPPLPSKPTTISPSGPSAIRTVREANDAYGRRVAAPDRRQPLPSRSNVNLSDI